MTREHGEPPTDPRTALWAYIVELETDYLPWYRRASGRAKWGWGIGQGVAIGAGVIASILAAASTADSLARSTALRAVLIVLPAVGALAASLLAQTHVRELLALRERGRETMQALLSRAKADYAAAQHDPARLSELHVALVAAVSQLERQQAADFLLVAPGGAAGGPSAVADSGRVVLPPGAGLGARNAASERSG